MKNNEAEIANLTKYLKKIAHLINNETKFKFFERCLISTKRLDDLFCCVESSWPKDYKFFIEHHGEINLKSPKVYRKLKEATKNRFALSSNYCIVYHVKALNAINSLLSAIKSDLDYIYKSIDNE